MKKLFDDNTPTIYCKGTPLASYTRIGVKLTRLSPEQRAWALRCGHYSVISAR